MAYRVAETPSQPALVRLILGALVALPRAAWAVFCHRRRAAVVYIYRVINPNSSRVVRRRLCVSCGRIVLDQHKNMRRINPLGVKHSTMFVCNEWAGCRTRRRVRLDALAADYDARVTAAKKELAYARQADSDACPG